MNESPPEPRPEMLSALAELADSDGYIELPDFLQTALYHPQWGYYCQAKERVGRNQRSDFYTSTSLREAFAEIVQEAAVGLLKTAGFTPDECCWVEIGCEPDAGLLRPDKSPFASHREIRVGQSLEIPSPAVVFSNELYDAQVFRQARFDGRQWQEFGVGLQNERLTWRPRTEPSEEIRPFIKQLSPDRPAGYTVDIPTGAISLHRELLSSKWEGTYIAFDYGKSWQGLQLDSPEGTGRAYYRHQLLADYLQSPGQVDITHHICWDHLEAGLSENGFAHISLQSQESFIAHRAPLLMQKAFDPSQSSLSPLRSKLRELMHPALMGQKFQALSATRRLAR